MYNTNSKSRNVKIAIAVICVIILTLCIISGSAGKPNALNSVNDAQTNEVVIDAADATTATDATETESTESTEATEADVDEDEEEKEVVEVPVYVYVPVETEPKETEPTTPPTTEPEEEDDYYEPLPEATKPEEETKPTPEEEEEEEEETTPVHVHNFSIRWTVVNPTCTAHGYTIYICDGCTATENRDFVEPIGHEYIVYEGEHHNTYWCSNCGDTYQVEVEAPAPADETVPVETEPVEEPVEETEPAPVRYTCDPSDGHNHKEVHSGPFTFVYCDDMVQHGITESADGRIKYFAYEWCL